MGKRKYENKKLKRYFERNVNKLYVENKYKPMLVDILMRRADMYDLSEEEIKQDVMSLLCNLDQIAVEGMPEGYEDASGLYETNKKKITIAEYVMNSPEQTRAYQTITHEVYHALSKDEDGNDRLGRFNTITGQYNSALLEAIVEKSSYRAVFGNDRQDNGYYNRSANGYGDITFIVDLLEATYGTSEKEFLQHAIMGREKLAEFLAERSGETPGSAYTFLDAIETNYAVLHRSMYPWEGYVETPSQRALNIEASLSGIYNLCEGKMAERIGRAQVGSYAEVVGLNNELKYNHNKITAIMNDRLEYFSQYSFPDMADNVRWNAVQKRNATLLRINDINSLVEAAPNFSDESNFMAAYAWAAAGELAQLPAECLNYYRITPRFQETLPITNEIFEAALEDEDIGPQYDNSKIPKMFKKINKKDNIFMRGINRVKNLFSRNNQNLLPEGSQPQMSSQIEESEIETIFPRLTKEEQEMYNSQVKQAVDSLGKNQTTEEIDRDIEEK